MKRLIHISLALLFIITGLLAQTSSLIPKFEIKQNPISLTRPAQPNQYMDKIGRKSALMGSENGSFELWIWPWKVLRNFDLQFFVGTTTQPILSKDIVRDINVTPEATTITFVYESFTVKEILFIPHDEPGAIILLDVYTTTPLTIVPGFMPVMQPHWPTGIGGQYSYWDDEIKGYIISESQRRGLFVCGSPVAGQMAAPPAHMFADNPLQFKFTIQPNKVSDSYIPIIIAGGHGVNRDSVFTMYKNLYSNPEKYYISTADFYQKFLNTTLQLITPDNELNLAFEFGKLALNNLMVENPTLGKGLVAGYGLSGGSGRPGFAWFFGGDAFINSLAMNCYGDYSVVKDALKFTQKWQRQDNFPIRKKSPDEKNIDIGKMAHELSQSDGLVDWWNDYHYGYNHADTTPWYLVAMGDYFRRTGDTEFIKQSWPSIKQAYQWCLSKDSNDDGLMDLKGAGLGVLEFGELVKIYNDMYTQGLWTQGVKEVNLMAKYVGDEEMEIETQKLLPIATESLERIFWMDEPGYYSFGADENGNQVKDKNIFPTSVMMFDILNKQRCEKSQMAFNESDIVTAWGIRNLSNKSSLYDPTNYNYGTVWGFNSFFAVTSQFKYHFNLAGYSSLRNTYQHIFDYGIGVFPEVFSGNINTKLGEAYHDQGFCVAGYIYPMVRGLLGLDVDAINKKIIFAPKLPANWEFLDVKNIYIGECCVNAKIEIQKGEWNLQIEKTGNDVVEMQLEPDFFPGTEILSVSVNGKPNGFVVEKHEQAWQLKTILEVSCNCEITIKYKHAVEINLLNNKTSIGAVDEELKIITQRFDGKYLILDVEGVPSCNYELEISKYDIIDFVRGAEILNNKLVVNIPGSEKEFKKHSILIALK
ncbi:MAG: GH116 family glycosyl hydrolase [bacterium]